MSAEQIDRQNEDREGDGSNRLVTLGRIVGPFGIQGWVKIHSYTEPLENIVRYSIWQLTRPGQTESRQVEQGKRHGKGVVAKIAGCDDRDAAEQLRGVEIAVRRNQFSGYLDEGEYYWTDLEGLTVATVEGRELGTLDHLFETGSNDVMEVQGDRDRLLPFTAGTVMEVDLEQGRIIVDWDPDF